MYNAEKYVGECLDSILNQTFTDFEVIAIDDCSTDNSAAIVESYREKFGGRLILSSMETNSGSGGLPRNKGLTLAGGEYVYFFDADDVLLKTALEEMYSLAKEYDADVVNFEKYYISTGAGEKFYNNIHLADKKKLQKPPFVNKPTFETENMAERVKKITQEKFWLVPWDKFVRRDLLLEHKIFFPQTRPSEDDIWTYGLVFYAKKFLRVPNMVYIRRMSDTSVTGIKRTPQQKIDFWLNPLLFGLKAIDNFMSKHEFFKSNPIYRFTVLKYFINLTFNKRLKSARALPEEIFYSTIKDSFGERLGDYDVLISALCTILYNEKKLQRNATQAMKILSNKPQDDITARIDVKFKSKTPGDFQIVSVSDDKATVWKPDWFQKHGVGYQIQSYAGNLEIIIKATADGQIELWFRGLDILAPEDNSKRIPYWIYYEKLIVDNAIIFDEITPAWHDKPYVYTFDVKADAEIKIQVEWLPHRSDT